MKRKIEVLIGLIQDEGYLRFNQSEDDFDDFETYDTEVQSQSLWVEGYENYILNDVPKMTFEDVIHIYNDIYESRRGSEIIGRFCQQRRTSRILT